MKNMPWPDGQNSFDATAATSAVRNRSMHTFVTVAVLSIAAVFSAPAGAQASAVIPAVNVGKLAKQLVGTWRLVRYVDTAKGEAPVYAFGEHPLGMFLFTQDGNFSISIMRNPPAPESASTDIDPDACIPAWYCSYFGKYRLDKTGSNWIAKVEGGNIPAYLGTDQTRAFKLVGNRIVITGEYEEGGRTVRGERVLERAP